MDNQVIKTHW